MSSTPWSYEFYAAKCCTHPRCRKPQHKKLLCREHLEARIKSSALAAQRRTEYLLRPGGRAIWLYAVKDGDAVKFGVAENAAKRFGSIQTGNPRKLELIGSVYCAETIESDVHKYLADLRIRGEWFRWTDKSRAIAMLIQARDLLGLLQFMDIEPANLELGIAV